MTKSIYEFAGNDDLSALTTYQAGALQASVHRSLQKHSDTILKAYGLSKMHWMIIGTVLDAGAKGIRITDLAELLGTTLPYLTTTINLLESKGMVDRATDTGDSRAKLVVIDPVFKPQCASIEKTLREALRKSIYAHVDPDEFRIYVKVLYQLAQVK